MKVFLFILLSGYALGTGKYNTISNYLGRGVNRLVQEKCRQNSNNESAFLELEIAVDVYGECKTSAFKTAPPHPLEDHQAFCNYMRNSGFHSCVENLGKAVKPCLDESEKYFPGWILQGITSTYDEVCGLDGVSNSEILFNAMTEKSDPCQADSSFRLDELVCLHKLTIYKNYEQGIINLNKHDVCLDLEKLHECTQQVMAQYCQNNYSNVLNLLFKPFEQECNEID